MKKHGRSCCVALTILISSLCPLVAQAQTVEAFTLSENGSGRATGYAEANKIVTWQGKTHVGWLDSVPSEDGAGASFKVRIRTLDHASGQWSPTCTIGDAQDNHGGPALAMDSKGYLHVAYGPHSNPMRYRRSLEPNDASAWTPEVEIGERLTYPVLLVGPDDTLYLSARNRTGAEWETLFFSKPADSDTWSQPTLIIKAKMVSYSHFQVAMAWGPDHKTMHLASRIYGGAPDARWCQMVGYMKSEDFGKTWQRNDGTTIDLPATVDTLDPIAVVDPAQMQIHFDTTTLRSGSIAVDRENRPCILYNSLQPDGSRPTQAWIARGDGKGNWEKILLNDKLTALPEGWSPTMPGGITTTPAGDLVIVLSISNPAPGSTWWGAPSTEVLYARSSDGGQTFNSQVITPVDADMAHWLPNLERATGFNDLPERPSVIYSIGEKGTNNSQLIANLVQFCTP
ncbi:MAG: BNR-4 repeat-containing protein [Phycisphaeraceae bacterium]|nr:BNR-4 repeat-containing protein [Phycisphaeraceae bacterium]